MINLSMLSRSTIGATLLLLAVPASASQGFADPAAQATASTIMTGAAATAAEAPKPKKYCMKEKTLGSHLIRKVCKTEKEWSAEGIDVTKR